MRRGMAVGLLAVIACAGCAPAMKDLKPALSANDSGTVWFATAGTLVRSPDQTRFVPGDPIVLSGDLRFPSGAGPFPTVVLAHNCAGIDPVVTGWEMFLRDWGYATFVFDSLRGRGLAGICSNIEPLLGVQRVPDAYGALRILATHPKVDSQRVVLMGFSHGGNVTMAASTSWAKDTYAPAGHPAFRAFLPFYPYCNTWYPERARVSAPVRIHSGALDDWTPAGPCVELANRLKASGQDVTITVYAYARHSFDNPGLGYIRLTNVDNGAKCFLTVASILAPASPQAISACVGRGATVEGNSLAADEARRNVRTQLTELLK